MRWPTGHTRCPQEVLDIDKVAAATSQASVLLGPPSTAQPGLRRGTGQGEAELKP